MIISGLKSFGNCLLSSYLKDLRCLSYKSETSKFVDEYHKTNKMTQSTAAEENIFGEIKMDDLEIKYMCSSKPGGQNVNKINSKVQIKFHVPSVKWIPGDIKQNFIKRESHRVTKDNYFLISSDKTRLQILNQADCLDRIRHAIGECFESCKSPEVSDETKKRWESILTKSNEKRLMKKQNDSLKKAFRKPPVINDL